MTSPTLIANLGGEEPDAPRTPVPAAERLGALWQQLFDPPVWPWLAEVGAAAWWNDASAKAMAEAAGHRLFGASPEVARTVHDKAFARSVAEDERLDPPSLRGIPRVFPPGDLTREAVEAALESWPDWAQQAFTLKPRIGTSARGRVAGSGGGIDAKVVDALPRLARCGGAVLEPWLPRIDDFAAPLYIDEDGGVTLLGTLRVVCSESGTWRGHRGELDSRGRPRTGLAEEEALREAAGLAGVAMANAGYRGPCGIDGFSFTGPESGATEVRPLVETNARFTAGHVAIGFVRRALPQIKQTLGLSPGELFHFWFATDARPDRLGADARAAGVWIALGPPNADASEPALFVSPDRSAIDALGASD